ncbi:Hypothetical_protein [Hexamita inflata]|uniref:Hypothetical_protein n=1 Tax=Hexamita inflata TaxID=28002 RepID=A0AA86TI79_9EUKA|nr:Hypothetical protein HINF_LOCUS4307 [Hexamita inflata]
MSKDNIRQQKSQKKITIAYMTVYNLTLRQTIGAKESAQTLGSRGTKKSTIKQVKHYQGYEAKIIPIIVGKNCTLHKESHLFLKELKVNMQTFYAEIGYKISRYAQMCNNSLYKKRNLEKETNLEEAPIGKLDMNKLAPLADLGEDNDKSEKEPIEKFLFQQNKWNNSHASYSDSYTLTSQMGENRRRKSNHQKANTSARQINRQNKFASLNSEDSSFNSGDFSHYQEQPHRKQQNILEPIIESLIKWITVLYRKPLKAPLKHFNL